MHDPAPVTLHFLVPFALPAAAEGTPVLNARATPALDLIVRHGAQGERHSGEDYQRSLSHEHWVAAQFGIAAAHDDGDLPLAPYMLLADGGNPGNRRWACLQPVHVEVAHDHLVLIDPQTLALDDADAMALADEAKASIEAIGMTFVAPTPRRWFIGTGDAPSNVDDGSGNNAAADDVEDGERSAAGRRANARQPGDPLGTLVGSSPLRATGRNIEIWLPYEPAPPRRSRAWMKLQNEIQMAWHAHPINEAREERRQLTVNSVWFHAQGVRTDVLRPFGAVFSNAAATRGLAMSAVRRGASPSLAAAAPKGPVRTAWVPDTLAEVFTTLSSTARADTGAGAAAPTEVPPLSGPVLIELDALASSFIAQDWGSWLAALADLDTRWFAPALEALRNGDIGELRITLCSDTGSVTLAVRRFDLKKFWRRGNLLSLLTD